MTLLATVIGSDFALICADRRITASINGRTVIVDENHNKILVFASDDMIGAISYTGLAQWTFKGKINKLHDVISAAVSRSVLRGDKFGPMMLAIMASIKNAMHEAGLMLDKYPIELHAVARHPKTIMECVVCVVSSFRIECPWPNHDELDYEWDFEDFRYYIRAAQEPTVVFGGATHRLTKSVKEKILHIARSGANASQILRNIELLIENISSKDMTVGHDVVAVVIPYLGIVDTNFNRDNSAFIEAYMPRIVWGNGVVFKESIFPFSLEMIDSAYLQRNEIMVRSILLRLQRRRLRRVLLKKTSGKPFPGLFGIMSFALFGKFPDEAPRRRRWSSSKNLGPSSRRIEN